MKKMLKIIGIALAVVIGEQRQRDLCHMNILLIDGCTRSSVLHHVSEIMACVMRHDDLSLPDAAFSAAGSLQTKSG